MKKNMFLGIFMSLSSIAFSQITDENGVSAIGVFNQQLSGKIGIGTSSPATQLDVNGTTTSNTLDVAFDNAFNGFPFQVREEGSSLLFNIGVNSISGYSGINHYDRNNTLRLQYSTYENNRTMFRLRDQFGSEAATFNLGNSSYGNFFNMPLSNSRIVIGSTGGYLFNDGHKLVVKDGSAMIEGNIFTNNNIGIGTSSFVDGPDTYRLSVEGRVRAHAVKVYTDWADFVFENTYKLPSLKEVEQHIKDHGHLKDIPSAKEVEENGIELGEMNKLLLQKIEELTLYTIQLKKEIDELKAKN